MSFDKLLCGGVSLCAAGGATAGPVSIEHVRIDGTDAIFLAGRTDLTIPPATESWPGGLAREATPESLQETLPPIFSIVPGSMVSVVAPATGLISFNNGFGVGNIDPDGDLVSSTFGVRSFGGISGYAGSSAPLVGVFLTDDIPSANAPATLDFSPAGLGVNFTTLSPGIGQVFHIGDGLTDGGASQSFVAPSNATRFAIGIADAFGGRGDAGFYTDNDGFYEITLSLTLIPAPGALAVLGLGGVILTPRRR